MEFGILGPLEAATDSAPVDLGPHKQRALLGVLLLYANEVVSVSGLIDAIWGQRPPPTASKLVQVYVSQLRRILDQAGGHGVVNTHAPGYIATVAPDQLDATRFTKLVAEARARAETGPLDETTALYDEALALWRGPVLADIKLEASALSAVERLRELRLAALSERADCELTRGRHSQLVPELEKLAAEHPLHERFWAQLMLALYRSGRQSEALAAYQQARRTLADEVGLSPSPELRQLERAIFAHDTSLQLDRQAETPAPAAPPARAAKSHRRAALAALLIVLIATAATAFALTRGNAFTPLARLAPNSIGIVDPRRNALVGEIRFTTRPAAIAVGDGSIWVAMQDDETLLRLDPRTHTVTQTIGLGAVPTDLTIGGRHVWVLCGHAKKLVEVDAPTSTVMRTIALTGKITVHGFEDIAPSSMAADESAAWLAAGPGLVIRIDPTTRKVEHIGSGWAAAVAAGGGAIWIVGSTKNFGGVGTVWRIDP